MARAPVAPPAPGTETPAQIARMLYRTDLTNPKAPALQVVLLKSATPLKTLTAPHYTLTPGSYTQVESVHVDVRALC